MKIPKRVHLLLERMEQEGYEAYLVGGCVRDEQRGEEPHDFDIATNATPRQTMALFPDFPIIETGLQHGTVAVIIEHEPIEITTYRIETTYSDHRHPDGVKFASSLQEDLSRRDFTINAMAMDKKGRLVDPFGGSEDLKAGLIRCVGEARQRLSEDALRILRALRFAARFGFSMEEKTKAALFDCAPLLKKIAAERILAELKGILVAPHAGEILAEYEPVLKEILPWLKSDCKVLRKLPPKESLRFAGWLWPMGREAGALLKSLKASNALKNEAMLLIEGQQISRPSRPMVRRLLARLGPALYEDHLLLQEALGRCSQEDGAWCRAAARTLIEEGACLSLKGLAIGGKELMELGFSGAKIGKMQKRLFEEVMEEKLPNEREALLEFAKKQEK